MGTHGREPQHAGRHCTVPVPTGRADAAFPWTQARRRVAPAQRRLRRTPPSDRPRTRVSRGLGRRRADQPVAEAVFGRDERLAGSRRVEAEPEVADRHPQQVDVAVVAGAPDRAEDLAVRRRAGRPAPPGRRATGTPSASGEPRRPRRWAWCSSRSTTRSRCCEAAAAAPGRSSPRAAARPRRGPSAREAERLGDVVVRAELQAADLVGLGAVRRDHQDRDAAELAEALDELPAIEARAARRPGSPGRVARRRTGAGRRARSGPSTVR